MTSANDKMMIDWDALLDDLVDAHRDMPRVAGKDGQLLDIKDMPPLDLWFTPPLACDHVEVAATAQRVTSPVTNAPSQLSVKAPSQLSAKHDGIVANAGRMTARQISRQQRLLLIKPAVLPAAAPTMPTMNDLDLDPADMEISIGTYTRGQRRLKVARYMQKRASRLERLARVSLSQKNSYECRSRYAIARPRIAGRFISLKGEAGQAALAEWRRLNNVALAAAAADMEDTNTL